MESTDLYTIFTVALLGSLGHCIGMCGGFVVAYSSAKFSPDHSQRFQVLAHLLYSLGRILSYMLIGAVFGYLGSAISFSLQSKGIMFIIIGLLMVLIGISLSSKLKFLTLIEHSLAQTTLFRTAFKYVIHSKSMISFLGMGILNGLIPCGLVYFFATASIASGSAFMGAIVMAVFGLATVPALFILGIASGYFTKLSWRQYALSIASIIIALYGLYTTFKGSMMIRNPEMIKSKMSHMKSELKAHEKELLK